MTESATIAPRAQLHAVATRAVEAELSRPPARDAAAMMQAQTDAASSLADAIADDVLAFLSRQIGHRADELRLPTKPSTGGAIAQHAHAQACLATKLRRIADAAAMLRKIG